MKGGSVMSDVLVLSKTWEAYDRVSWERAFVLLGGGDDGKKKVEVVEYHERTVRSGSLREWKVPSVIRFIEAVTPEICVVKFSRENIYTRDKGVCQYCGTQVKLSEFEYEHVVPRAKGGKTTWENIVVACTPCNQKKGGRTPAEARMRIRSTPRRPDKSFKKRRMTLSWQKGMPEAWKGYMRNITYWSGELDNENGG
jgi:5-methylcytosine-specific restriction endonuclease McrA